MTKIIQAKYKLSRRHMVNVWGRVKDPVASKNYPPGQHGPTARPKQKDYLVQLRAKQILKGYYSMTEKQFRRVYGEAVRRKGDTSENLVGLLESRLASVVYRLNWAATIFGARQLVSHGHVKVNGRRVTVGSYRVKAEDVIELDSKMQQNVAVMTALNTKERDVPGYITSEGVKASFKRAPQFDEIPYPFKAEPNLVIEFYSR